MTDLSAFGLAGRRIVVTGANTGIGQGISVAVARAGGAVIGVGRSSMEETAALVEAKGGVFTPVACDLGDHAAAGAMLDEVWQTAGPVDGLVNNAGIIRRADAVDFSETDWDDVMDVNLKSLFFLCQLSRERFWRPDARGASSTSPRCFPSGRHPRRLSASSMAWSAIRGCWPQWAAKGINVNAIAPGYVVSNNTQALRNDPDRSAAILGRIPRPAGQA